MAKTVKPKRVSSRFYAIVGFCLLVLNKIRHEIQGYTRPRPFSAKNIQQAIDYDVDVFRRLHKGLVTYTKKKHPLKGKTVLELGPGPDLGISLLSLKHGAKKYLALDINPLADKATQEFYAAFVDQQKITAPAERQLQKTLANQPEKIQYVVEETFDPRVFYGEEIDIVISHAAFEHFDEPETTIAQLSEVMASGSIFLAAIDLQTHTRWIRDADPLNIYRYADLIWDTFAFSGSPNRVRPEEYVYALEQNGFTDIQVIPRIVLESSYVKKVRPTLHRQFRTDEDLPILDFYLLARKN